MHDYKVFFLFLFLNISLFLGVGNMGIVGAQTVSTEIDTPRLDLTSENIQNMKDDLKKSIQNGTIQEENLPPHLLGLLHTDVSEVTIQGSTSNPDRVSCFDYYTFGSIDVDISSATSSVVSGTSMEFTGMLKNDNPYPIVQGTLFVKIFKDVGDEKNPNGPDVVDQFIAVDNVTLPAHGSSPISFTWRVPAYATSGEYRLATYFTSDKKFNLLGLSFTDDIVGNVFPFSVSGEQEQGVVFDKSSVVINDSPYYFAAYPTHIPVSEQAHISLLVDNNTLNDQIAHIEWKLYKWDAMNDKNFIKTFQTTVFVKSNSTEKVSLEIPEQEEPVYLLIGTLTYQDTKSIVNIRYVREGVDKVRLNFPSITSYPIQKNVPITLFTCLHNSGQSAQVPNNKVVLEIIDKKEGVIVESYTYEGIVTGDMMAVKKDFVPKKNLTHFTVHASLYTDGVLVDESSMEYDCSYIDATKCTGKPGGYKQFIGFLLVILLGIAGIAIFVIKKKHPTIISLLLLFSLGCIFYPQGAEAKSINWNTIVERYFFYFYNQGINTKTSDGNYSSSVETGWANALKNPNITVKYNVQIKNLTTNTILSGGESIPVGTRIQLNFIKHVYTDISWFGTGYSGDSPYGEWREEGTSPPKTDTCKQKDFVTNYKISKDGRSWSWGVYIPLVIDSPNKSISDLDGLSDCVTNTETEINGMSMECTVSTAGTLHPQFNFSSTKGKFYYRYKDANACIGNNVPLKVTDSVDTYWYGFWIAEKNLQEYLLIVPAKTISYTFNAYTPPPANRLPLAPVITGSATGQVSTPYTFNFQATDPDGDTISYGVDWDNNGSVDQWLPAIGTVSSGTSQSASKSWSTIGAKTFQALTKDSKGAISASWGRFTITLTDPPLSATCTLSASSITPHQSITWTAISSGGTGAYTYSWSGTDGLTGSTNPLTKIYTTSGAKNAATSITSGMQTIHITCPSLVVLDDICGNIGDFQGSTPTGLQQSGSNCICPI